MASQTPQTSSSFPNLSDPNYRQQCVNEYNRVKLMRLFDFVDYHAGCKGSSLALREFNTGEDVTWSQFRTATNAFAAKLIDCGLKKGDIVATILPNLKEHIYLMIACMRLGVILAPLDLRLKEHEVAKCFDAIKPRMFFFLGSTPVVDFRPMVKNLMANYKMEKGKEDDEKRCITHWVQFQKEKDQIIDGAIGILDFTADVKKLFIMNLVKNYFGYGTVMYEREVKPQDPCVIIFTTGSTGKYLFA